ncbi:MAG: hypothetical protein OXC00_02550, partial [Acidimicrobiaceae bacterium]|nr:hypothetical protein [Acidimicrobiaceae bacterium]
AAHADHHLALEKTEAAEATLVGLRTLSGEDRLVELSRMLSGTPQSASALQHAKELLEAAASRRAG